MQEEDESLLANVLLKPFKYACTETTETFLHLDGKDIRRESLCADLDALGYNKKRTAINMQ